MMHVDFSKFIISILFVGLFMGADLWTKHEVSTSSVFHGSEIDLGKTITINEPVKNFGGPGVFGSDTPELKYRYWHIFGVIFSLFCFSVLVLFNENLWHSAIGAVPVGGMCGNVWELVVYGGATDFITFSGLGALDGFIFNVADIFIMLGLPVYYLTSEMTSWDKMTSLIICISIFSFTLGLLPSDPGVYMAIGCLYLVLFWPDTRDQRVP